MDVPLLWKLPIFLGLGLSTEVLVSLGLYIDQPCDDYHLFAEMLDLHIPKGESLTFFWHVPKDIGPVTIETRDGTGQISLFVSSADFITNVTSITTDARVDLPAPRPGLYNITVLAREEVEVARVYALSHTTLIAEGLNGTLTSPPTADYKRFTTQVSFTINEEFLDDQSTEGSWLTIRVFSPSSEHKGDSYVKVGEPVNFETPEHGYDHDKYMHEIGHDVDEVFFCPLEANTYFVASRVYSRNLLINQKVVTALAHPIVRSDNYDYDFELSVNTLEDDVTESSSPKSGSASPKYESESPKSESELPKSESKSSKSQSISPKSESLSPKSGISSPKPERKSPTSAATHNIHWIPNIIFSLSLILCICKGC